MWLYCLLLRTPPKLSWEHAGGVVEVPVWDLVNYRTVLLVTVPPEVFVAAHDVEEGPGGRTFQVKNLSEVT